MVTRKIKIFVFSWILCFCTLAYGNDDAKTAFDRASKLFNEKSYSEALPHFQRAYELSNRRPAAIRGLAQCEWALGMYDEALEHFHEYLATNPPDAESVRATIPEIEREREAKRAAAAPPVVNESPQRNEETRSDLYAAPASSSPEEESSSESVFSSPVFWIATGAVVVATVTVVLIFALGKSCDPNDPETFLDPNCFAEDFGGLKISF